MAEIQVSPLAYSKLVLHLAKYPHSACNGILLAKSASSSSSSSSSSSKQQCTAVNIVDSVPLFHTSLALTAPFEIALNQIDAYCQQNALEIVGHYHSNENLKDTKPGLIAYKIAEKIRENCSQSLVFMINNEKLNPINAEPCFRVYNFVDQNIKELSSKVIIDQTAYKFCTRLLNERKFKKINDFDNHLDDISLDWRNLEFSKLMVSSSQSAHA